MIFLGIVAVGSLLRFFEGMPYTQNGGWHRADDPDIVATNTKGAFPSQYLMLQADRDLELKEKQKQNDQSFFTCHCSRGCVQMESWDGNCGFRLLLTRSANCD
jgi:hypothetical protein